MIVVDPTPTPDEAAVGAALSATIKARAAALGLPSTIIDGALVKDDPIARRRVAAAIRLDPTALAVLAAWL